ncbi:MULTISPECIES: GlxA family transcriptional regulator [unclassified Nocardioides]|uniref:GlxA family transcriptional regulator n=1 Tax=unclassified Nocardioides TaxID=2615069 RepID=UPI0007002F0B|nr:MULTISPECIES: helix-turn-helix domain-containing protein [unclassified Nocardioides]KQY56333.1 AraC family transcriptional regulator [Nocardioides sp. Root140]KRF14195.1 AraC family transcriptional regulator [Nocardioides sp. Soil796]
MSAPHRVVVLALPPVIGYDLVIPTLVFSTANTDPGKPRYDVTVASLDGRPVPTSAGYDIAPHSTVDALAAADTVIVPGTQIDGPRRHGVLPDDLRDALALIRPGTRLMSICTGAFVLAAAGLLDGRPATTHWSHAESFRALYPHVDLDENALFVDDGDVLTSAGLAAGMDLCLHVVRRDHGSEVANHVARYCVVPPWRDGGQAQFIEKPLPEAVDESTAAARDWALAHLDQPIAVSELATRARMSVRTFARRFRAETGHSPGAWLIVQRIRYAQRLLETSDLSVDMVAAKAGLGTGASLRQHLRAVAGVSPTAYRRTFRGTAPLVG